MGESAPLITLRGVVLGALTPAGMLYYVVVVGQGIGAGAQRPLVFFYPGLFPACGHAYRGRGSGGSGAAVSPATRSTAIC